MFITSVTELSLLNQSIIHVLNILQHGKPRRGPGPTEDAAEVMDTPIVQSHIQTYTHTCSAGFG